MKKIIVMASLIFVTSSCEQIKEKLGLNKDLTSELTVATCEYTNLSNKNNYKLIVNQINADKQDEFEYIVQVLDKSNKVLQTITTNAKIDRELLETIKGCAKVKSLVTQHNLAEKFEGFLFDGNFVIGDYNFDGKDDVAIYAHKDENSGKYYYDYYLQKQDGKFEKDTFLSVDTDYLGKKYDINSKMVVLQNNESIKKFAFENNQWKLKEELKDPFPKAMNSGYIAKKEFNTFKSQFPKDGLNIYDQNFKIVGNLYAKDYSIDLTIHNKKK